MARMNKGADSLESARTLRVERQLRPVRLAFLVSPSDKENLARVVGAATSLWGGPQNPIIPVYRRRPHHWEEERSWPGGAAYVQGLLSAYEPDFVVESTPGLARGLVVPPGQVISLSDVLDASRERHVEYGTSAVTVFQLAYERELKFVRRHRLRSVWAGRTPPTLFGSIALGRYPEDRGLEYLADSFEKAFEPEKCSGDAADAFNAAVTPALSPLRAACYLLDVKRHGSWRANDPVLFVLDPNSIVDLLDYWNLRAWGWRCLPVAYSAIDAIAADVLDLIKRANVRLQGNPDPNMRHRSTLLKSRTLTTESWKAVESALAAAPARSLVTSEFLPSHWDLPRTLLDHDERAERSAHEDTVVAPLDDGIVEFDLLTPEFEDFDSSSETPRWANTIRLVDYSSHETGLVLPESGDLADLLRVFGSHGLRANRAGVAVFSTAWTPHQRWHVADGEAVIRHWFAAQDIAFAPSPAGRTALDIFRHLGGLHATNLIASVPLLESFKKAAGGHPILQTELVTLLKKARPQAADNILRRLVGRRVIRLGLVLACEHCDGDSWHPFEELRAHLACPRCLRNFRFPAAEPSALRRWAYRTQGPFALPGHAQGAYATLLALQFLGPKLHGEMSWFPGGEIQLDGRTTEVDFVALWRKQLFRNEMPRVVFGEAKTLDEFAPRDIARLRSLGQRFPEAVRVFATLRTELEEREKVALRGLVAEARRRANRPAAILILTGVELLSDRTPPGCYESAGGRFEQFTKPYYFHGEDDLTSLAETTQQIHLGAQPYWEWWDEHRKRASAKPGPKRPT